MLPGHSHAVSGDTDIADQSFCLCLDHGLDRTAAREGRLPLVGIDQVVQLDQVDMVSSQPFERALDLLVRERPGPASP